MIAFDKTAEIPRKPEEVWARLAEQARSAADESLGTARKLVVRGVQGSGLGCRFEAGNPDRRLVPWEVVEWRPPFLFACRSEKPGWFRGHVLLFRVDLEPAGASSRMRMQISLVFNNPLLELWSNWSKPALPDWKDAEDVVGKL
ncbi:MAG TPA: hypothetical protein DCM05_00785 [Elusimicrobia bacterium]|nr:hypothetical protein [Elusimicrobiota bacterium]